MLNLKKSKCVLKKYNKPGYIQLILIQFRIELLQSTIKPFRTQYNIKSQLHKCLITLSTQY